MKIANHQPGYAGTTGRFEAILSAGLNLCACCEIARRNPPNAQSAAQTKSESLLPPRSFARRFFDIAAWLAPGVTLVLLPKCPACLAAYVALLGVGISVVTSSCLRTALVILCVGSLILLTMRHLRARMRRQLAIDQAPGVSLVTSGQGEWVHRMACGARQPETCNSNEQ